ncbi:hypothetical protein ACHAWF_011895, partial [Thalassiosira exigua]
GAGRERKRPIEEVGKEESAESLSKLKEGSTGLGSSEASVGGVKSYEVPVQEIMTRLSSLEQDMVRLSRSVAQIQASSWTRRVVPNSGDALAGSENACVGTKVPTVSGRRGAGPGSRPPPNRGAVVERDGVKGSVESVAKTRRRWRCDRCLVAMFDAYDDAVDHERVCPGVEGATAGRVLEATVAKEVTVNIKASDDGGRRMGARVGNECQRAMRQPPEVDRRSSTNVSPSATLRKGAMTLEDLWREYKAGFDGSKPAELFTHEERYGQGEGLRLRYVRREHVWHCIDHLIRRGSTSEQAIEKITQVYGRNTGLTKLYGLMCADKKKYPKTGFHPDFDEIPAPSEQHVTKCSESMGTQGARTQLPTGVRQEESRQQMPTGSQKRAGRGPAMADPRPATLQSGKRITTFDALWAEYKVGIDGNKPAELFTHEERYGQGQALRRRYAYREHMWHCIDRLVRAGCTSENAIDKIRQVYGYDMPVMTLCERIRADKKKYPKTMYHPILVEMMAPSEEQETEISESL